MGCGVSKMETNPTALGSPSSHHRPSNLSSSWSVDGPEVAKVPATAPKGASRTSAELLSRTSEAPKWRKGTLIGVGRFGDVYNGVLVDSGELIAAKCIEFDGKDMRQVQNELDIYLNVKHANVVQYRGCEVDMSAKQVWILMEWVSSGSIRTLVSRCGKLQEELVARFALDALRGISYLHEHRIVHGDVQSGNLLVDGNGHVKVGDFGSAVWVKGSSSNSLEVGLEVGEWKKAEGDGEVAKPADAIDGRLTAPYFVAPEVAGGEPATNASDIWSWAGSVLHMAKGSPPFVELGFEEPEPLLHHIRSLKADTHGDGGGEGGASKPLSRPLALEPRPLPAPPLRMGLSSSSRSIGADDIQVQVPKEQEVGVGEVGSGGDDASTQPQPQSPNPFIPPTLSPLLRSLLTQCFNPDPALRPTSAKLLQHPFFEVAKGKAASQSSSSSGRAQHPPPVVTAKSFAIDAFPSVEVEDEDEDDEDDEDEEEERSLSSDVPSNTGDLPMSAFASFRSDQSGKLPHESSDADAVERHIREVSLARTQEARKSLGVEKGE